MANYVSICRSNYFKVKDENRFARWCSFFGLQHWTNAVEGHQGTFPAIAVETGDGWPSSQLENGEDFEFDDELQKHLDPATIAVLVSADHEALRFVGGHAAALHAVGRAEYISLNGIHDIAWKAFGDAVTITEAIF